MRARWIEKATYGLGLLTVVLSLGDTTLRGRGGAGAGNRRELDVGGTWLTRGRRSDRPVTDAVEVTPKEKQQCGKTSFAGAGSGSAFSR